MPATRRHAAEASKAKTRTAPRYYAMSWTHGRGTTTTTGMSGSGEVVRAANYRSFATRAKRDAWVKGGASYRTERDYREALPASDSELRRCLAQDAEDGHSGRYGSRVPTHEAMVEADELMGEAGK
jgi:hypothetical protein